MSKKPKPAAVAVAPAEDPITKEIEALVDSAEVKELREKVETEAVTPTGNRKPVVLMDDDAETVIADLEAALPKVEAPVVEVPKASVPEVKQVTPLISQKTIDEIQRGAELLARHKAR